MVLGDLGLLIVPGSHRKNDITAYAPQVRSDDPSYQDFTQQQTWVMSSFHHGRGALEWADPFSFYDSTNADTRIREQLILAPLQNLTTKAASASVAGNPIKFYLSTTAATLFLITGGASRDAFQWDNTNSIWAAETSGVTADPTDITDFLGDLWVAQGQGNAVRRKSAGVWSASWSGAVFFAAAGSQVLYWSYNTNEIYFATANPNTAANRRGPIYVGDTNTQIRSLCIWDNRLYIGKDDGLYVLQEGRVTQVLDFSFARDANNFRWMKVWKGSLYFPILNGLYRLLGGTALQSVGPNRGAAGAVDLRNIAAAMTFLEAEQRTYKSLAAGKTGRVVDLVPTENFLFAAIDGTASGTSQLLASSEPALGWHQIAEGAASGSRVRAAFFTSNLTSAGTLSIPRLWYGYGNDPYNIILPDGTDDPYEYTSETYATTGLVITPWFFAGLHEVWKEWQECILARSEGLSSTETVQVAYQLDDMTTWQNLIDDNGTAYAFTFSPYQRIRFPPNTISKRIRLRITLARGGTTTLTPKVKTLLVKFMARPDTLYVHQVTVRSGRNMDNGYLRQKVDVDPVELVQYLERARESRSRLAFDDGDLEPGITNLVIDSQFRLSSAGLATNWNLVGTPTASISIPNKIVGLQSQQLVTNATALQGVESDSITVTAGTRYTASVYVQLSAGDPVTLGLWDPAAGAFIGDTTRWTRVNGTEWWRLEITAVPTVTAVRLRVVRLVADATAATTFRLCAAQLETTDASRFAYYSRRSSKYADGEQARCRWSGAPHASTSIRDATRPVFVSNIGETEIQRPSIPDLIRGRGVEYRTVLSLVEVGT